MQCGSHRKNCVIRFVLIFFKAYYSEKRTTGDENEYALLYNVA